MGMNQTPSGERIQIGFFGRRNAGKSSLVNAVTGQELAVVSDVMGTTTDPVRKAMELLPLGSVVMIDTPGIDDEGELGEKRVGKSLQILNLVDMAILVIDAKEGIGTWEERMIDLFRKKEIPYLLVFNKEDLASQDHEFSNERSIWVSAKTGKNIHELKERMARLLPQHDNRKKLVQDLVLPGDTVVLVIPIDKSAPKGRLILPQQQVIRELLDMGAYAYVCREDGLSKVLASVTEKPTLVITDSQVFPLVARTTPPDVRLTSFSILFARYKGNLEQAYEGARALETLKDGDRILISEGCTHHRQCEDIGTVKLPAWIRQYTGVEPEFTFTSGTEFPERLSGFHMVVHCGGCMLNEREMRSRLRTAMEQEIPMTNYGILIAYMKGILERSIQGMTPVGR